MSKLIVIKKEELTGEQQHQIFEQYKMYVELADRVSQRRINVNSFFITANATLLTIASGFKGEFGNYMYLIAVTGIAISLFWLFSIRSYKQLNSGKFKVIHEIETYLPMDVFTYEWKLLDKGKSFKKYWKLSHVEMAIPLIFTGLYVALSIFVHFNIQ